MKKIINKIITNIIGDQRASKVSLLKRLFANYYKDLSLYYKHSTILSLDTLNKLECQLILEYHSIEKGLLFKNTKPRFGKDKIVSLHLLLNKEQIKNAIERTQIAVAYSIMCEYYEYHKNIQVDISDYFTLDQYESYKKILGQKYDLKFHGAIDFTHDEFYSFSGSDFMKFSHSRKSIRNFTGEKIPNETIEKAIKLALNTPSSCNRQTSKVYLVDDKVKIDDILHVQGGMNGFTKNINQLLILTTDRNYFFSIGERNQFYIDGGMFLMNLLYALHYNKIANCPANWGKTFREDNILEKIVHLPKSEKVICIIPIGIAESEFRVTLSKRRDLSEVFKII